MLTNNQYNNNEWIIRLQNTLKLHKVLEKGYWLTHYGIYAFKDIRERRLKSSIQIKEIRKLENKIVKLIK